MNKKILKLAKFNRENPGMIRKILTDIDIDINIIKDNCPHSFELESSKCEGSLNKCISCWTNALNKIKE